MLDKHFDDISLIDIELLKKNEIEEGLYIDYKEKIETKGDKKNDLLYDIVSFANSAGGNLIVGVEEDKGIITKIIGIELDNSDQYILQINNLIRDSIEPNIIGIRIKTHYLNESNTYILHIYIPKSLTGPHMAKGKFYGRNSKGNYLLDYTELRHKFFLQSEIQKQVIDYRMSRIMKIKANEGYWKIPSSEGVLLLNIMPFSSFTIDHPYINLSKPNGNFAPLYHYSGFSPYIQFSGVGAVIKNKYMISYHHLTHDGITELIDTNIINIKPTSTSQNTIFVDTLMNELVETFKNVRSIYESYNIRGQFAFCFSLLNVSEFKIVKGDFFHDFSPTTNESDLIFPSIIFNSEDSIEDILKPIDNLFFNAAGKEATN